MPTPSRIFACVGRTVHAIDQQTGAIIWETPIAAGRTQMVVHQDRVYVASETGSLEILNADTGTLLKTVPISGRGHAATILIEDETVFVSCGGELSAFDLNGTQLWANNFKGKGNGTLSLATTQRDRQADEY